MPEALLAVGVCAALVAVATLIGHLAANRLLYGPRRRPPRQQWYDAPMHDTSVMQDGSLLHHTRCWCRTGERSRPIAHRAKS